MELNDKALSSASDIVVIGGGHNGLVAATMLARSGKSVVILERLATLGGAAVSESPFAGVDARVSRYSYLVSLFPRWLLRDLNVAAPVRRRTVSSYTPSVCWLTTTSPPAQPPWPLSRATPTRTHGGAGFTRT